MVTGVSDLSRRVWQAVEVGVDNKSVGHVRCFVGNGLWVLEGNHGAEPGLV